MMHVGSKKVMLKRVYFILGVNNIFQNQNTKLFGMVSTFHFP